jgi:hypothetical protein
VLIKETMDMVSHEGNINTLCVCIIMELKI